MKEIDDIKLLRDKCLLFIEFLIEKNLIPQNLVTSHEITISNINVAYNEKKIKPLRVMSADIDDQVIRHMPLGTAIEFKEYLKKKLNIDYVIVEEKRKKIISKVLKKGKISNLAEYELIINRVDEIFADSEKSQELKNLNELLKSYTLNNRK